MGGSIMYRKLIGALVGLAMMGLTGQSHATIIHDVVVAGITYDVTLGDGSCSSLWSPCTATTDLDFASESDAIAAGLALLAALPLALDTMPWLIDGCAGADPTGCILLIPFEVAPEFPGNFIVTSKRFGNFKDDLPDFLVGTASHFSVFDIQAQDFNSFARFVRVPEPSSLFLFGAGLIGLLGVNWRRRRRKQA